MSSAVCVDIEDPEALCAYLRETGRISAGEQPQAEVLGGGVSNRTVLLRRPDGESWVIKQALRKLRVEADWYSDPARIEREALGMDALGRWLPPESVPRLIFLDRPNHILAMEAVAEPHENWKSLLMEGRLCDDHIRQFAVMLAAVHSKSAEDPEAPRTFADRSFFEGLRLEPYYGFAAARVPEASEFLRNLMAETRGVRECVVHGDYSPKNILVHNGRLVLLDHEVIHFGDPAFDVGFSLTHLLGKAHHLVADRARFVEAALAYWNIYYTSAGRKADDRAFFRRSAAHTLGCLLARVDGRSPLEYLSPDERRRQREAVVGLMTPPPQSVPELVESLSDALLC